MKELMFLAIIHGLLVPTWTINGVIWNKKQQKFVPIFSISDFAVMKQGLLAQSRQFETHNFQNEIIKFAYSEDKNIIDSCNQKTKITGLVGEIWNMLSQSLNFTLKTIKTVESTGTSLPNGSFTGLLGLLQRNETDIVPTIEAYPQRLVATQFSLPLWRNRYFLYVQPQLQYVPTWMVKLFSWKCWCCVLLIYLLVSICGFGSQVILLKHKRQQAGASFLDHLFYNFAMICSQSYIPKIFYGRPKMLEFCLGLFSVVIKTAFSALLIGYMTQQIFVPPFNDLYSLLDQTSYKIVSIKDSLPYIGFRKSNDSNIRRIRDHMDRVLFVSTDEEMYSKACSAHKYAMFESEYSKIARGRDKDICELSTAGIPYFEMVMSSGIARNFNYKRSIDLGLIRLQECGLTTLLKNRWIFSKGQQINTKQPWEPIYMNQIFLIITIFLCGVLISLLIFIIENVRFYHSSSRLKSM